VQRYAATNCNGMLPPSATYHPRRRRAVPRLRFDQDVRFELKRVRCGLPKPPGTPKPPVQGSMRELTCWRQGRNTNHQSLLYLFPSRYSRRSKHFQSPATQGVLNVCRSLSLRSSFCCHLRCRSIAPSATERILDGVEVPGASRGHGQAGRRSTHTNHQCWRKAKASSFLQS
jgi:hypothetical protein